MCSGGRELKGKEETFYDTCLKREGGREIEGGREGEVFHNPIRFLKFKIMGLGKVQLSYLAGLATFLIGGWDVL